MLKEEKQKKKICALTTISKTMDWFIVDSMRNLSDNGYEVTLICDMENGFKERNSDYANCINIPMKRGVNLKDLLEVPLRLRKIFKTNRFDIIYYTSPNVSLYASIGGWLAGIKNRVYNQWGLRYVSFEGKKRRLFWLVEKITCMFSTTIRSASPENRLFAIEEHLCSREKISVNGIGGTIGVKLVDCDCFDHNQARENLRKKYGIPQNAFVYGYVGRINADKGINELVEAFIKIQRKTSNMYLVMVGMLDDSNPVKEENLKIIHNNKNIILTGNVNTDQVYQYMAMMDVLSHPTYREGFGKVLQEAMGMRLPIITTDVPGPREVVEKDVSGILVEVRNVDDLAKKMEILYEDKELRMNLAKAGRKRAEQYFDRPIMLKNILDDLNKISV